MYSGDKIKNHHKLAKDTSISVSVLPQEAHCLNDIVKKPSYTYFWLINCVKFSTHEQHRDKPTLVLMLGEEHTDTYRCPVDTGQCMAYGHRYLLKGKLQITYHTAARTVRTIFTCPTPRLDSSSALSSAALPWTPSCPKHMRGAQQMLIAVPMRRGKQGGKEYI